MKNLSNLYESSGNKRKALRILLNISVDDFSEMSNLISDELIDSGKNKLNSEWMKLTRDARSALFDLDEWIKKNVK